MCAGRTIAMSFPRKAYVLFLAAVLLAGFGRIALLPPFEGADEPDHYSRIKTLALLPPGQKEDDHLLADVTGYTRKGPMAPGWISNGARHAYDPLVKKPDDAFKVYMDYRDFFARPEKVAAYKVAFRDELSPRRLEFAGPLNWDKQHPGLYYLLMSRAYRLLPPLPLVQEFFALRTLSFLLSFAGLIIGLAASARYLKEAGYKHVDVLLAAGAFFPLTMPSFYMDTTRLGNDNGALFMFSIVWALFLPLTRKPGAWPDWMILGAAMGMGSLVKATIVPTCFVMTVFLALRRWRACGDGVVRPLGQTAVILLTAAAFGWKGYADILGTGHSPDDMQFSLIHDLALGGLNGQGGALAERALFTLTSAVYYFTDWTVGLFPPGQLLIRLLPALAAVGGYAAFLARRRQWLSPEALPLWALPPLIGGLMVHDWASLTPGYYIFPLTAAIAFAYALGAGTMICGKDRATWMRAGAIVFFFCLSLLSLADYLWKEAKMYAGCHFFLLETPEAKIADMSAHTKSACTTALIFDRLGVLSWPGAALAFLAAAFLCALAGLVVLLRDTGHFSRSSGFSPESDRNMRLRQRGAAAV
jgi:hypothetical protein